MRYFVRLGAVSRLLLPEQIHHSRSCGAVGFFGASPVEDECLGGALCEWRFLWLPVFCVRC